MSHLFNPPLCQPLHLRQISLAPRLLLRPNDDFVQQSIHAVWLSDRHVLPKAKMILMNDFAMINMEHPTMFTTALISLCWAVRHGASLFAAIVESAGCLRIEVPHNGGSRGELPKQKFSVKVVCFWRFDIDMDKNPNSSKIFKELCETK